MERGVTVGETFITIHFCAQLIMKFKKFLGFVAVYEAFWPKMRPENGIFDEN